jgi:hypothetical protein
VLYRPGYKSVTILADHAGKAVSLIDGVAQPEPLELQGQADELESLCWLSTQTKSVPVSPEHRKVLLFLISECERLAAVLDGTPMPRQHELVVGTPDSSTPPVELDANGPIQMRLRSRAEELRRLADEGTEKAAKPKNLSAKNSNEAGKALKEWLERAGRKGLPALTGEADTALALAAAWEHFIGPGTKDVTPQPKEFLKYFEDRNGVKVPLRWEYCIVMDGLSNSPNSDALIAAAQKKYLPQCDFLVQGNQKLNGREIGYCPQPRVDTKMGFYSPQNLHVERKDDKIVLTSGEATVTVQDSKFDEEMKHPHEFGAVHFGPQRTFIAMYEMSGGSFPLFCVDSQTGKMLWQTEIWAWGHHVTLGRWLPDPDMMFAETENQIFVFGKSCGTYVEAFDIENGNPTLRFTPDHYWPNDSDLLARWRRNLRR